MLFFLRGPRALSRPHFKNFAATRDNHRSQLPRRTIAALTGGFIVAAVAATLFGPSLQSVVAEEDSRLEYIQMLRSERGTARSHVSAQPPPQAARAGFVSFFPSFFTSRPAKPEARNMAYAPALRPIDFGPFTKPSAPQKALKQIGLFTPVRESATDHAASLSRRSVCVRLCDGFHFPVGDYNGPGDNAAHGAVCGGMCPGAPTRLYVQPAGSDKIEDAVSARDNRPYRLLPVAFRHTSNRDDTCSCHGPDESAANNVSLLKDFTLRRGDKVMTPTGFRVFRGNASLPYRPTDFASLANSRDVTNDERSALNAIERASGIGLNRSLSPSKTAAGKSEPPASMPSRIVKDANGKPIRLIGPQALLLQSSVAPTP